MAKNTKADQPPLSEDEGSLLALIQRYQPVTAYQLIKIYAESPVSRFNESPGSVYPSVKRLKARGLIDSQRKKDDRRGTTTLSCSDEGNKAALRWIMGIDKSHVLLDDPWRTRVLSFGHLDHQQQRQWIDRARDLVALKQKELDAFNDGLEIPFKEESYENVRLALAARLDWLEFLSRSLNEGRAT